MIDVEKVRRDFLYLDKTLYLNTAACGLSWTGQGLAPAAFYDRMMSQGYDGRESWRALVPAVQSQLASLMSVEPDEISFVGSTTEGLNLVMSALPVKAGERVVLANDEFPSMQAACHGLSQRGATVDLVRITREEDRTEALCKAVRGARVVGVSHVQWHTGTKIDLKQLSNVCQHEGCLLIVDGIQALGATPVDASEADAYAASVFKWLLSGFGLGILVVRRGLQQQLTPTFRGYFNPEPSRDLRYGHLNYPALATLQATLTYLEGLGWEPIFNRTQELRKRLHSGLLAIGAKIATPDNAAAGILAIRSADSVDLAKSLNEHGARVEARGDLVRISPYFYNTEDEIDRFCTLIGSLRPPARS